MGNYLSRQSRVSSTCRAGEGGQFDEVADTWVVHLWLVNDNVSPPVYLHMPAVLDTGCQEELLIPLKDAQQLQLAEDTLMTGRGIIDAAQNNTPILTYKPVRVLVPMLDEQDGQLAFYTPGWLTCTSFERVALREKARLPSAAAAYQHVKEAGAKAIAMVSGKSEAWVQTRPHKASTARLAPRACIVGIESNGRAWPSLGQGASWNPYC